MSLHRIALSAVLTGILCGAVAAPAGAVTADVSGTTLRVNGDGSAERITVSIRTLSGVQFYTVTAAGANDASRIDVASGPGCGPLLPNDFPAEEGQATCASQSVKDVAISGLGGDDRLEIEPERPGFEKVLVPVRVDGGAGSDTIGVDSNPTRVDGGGGNDQIGRRCGPGAATLQGGAGADVISACDSGTADRAGGPVKIIDGGRGNDALNGSAGRDRITGGPGIDGLTGQAGHDRLDAGAGSDQVTGGKGDDMLLGRGGNDGLVDNQGANVISGAAGDDALFTLTVGSRATGSSRVAGGPGDDTFMIRNRRRDRASGGPGQDSAVADGIDVRRSIESVLTQIPRIPGVPRP